MPTLALDVDETLYPLHLLLAAWRSTEGHAAATADQVASYRLLGGLDLPDDEAVELITGLYSSVYGVTLPPVAGAVAGCRQLVDAGWRLVAVTNRTYDQRYATWQWLDFYFGTLVSDLYCCDGRPSGGELAAKVDVCRSLGAVGLVDDHLDNVAPVAAAGLRALLFDADYPWSPRGPLPAGVERVRDWGQVVAAIGRE